MVRDADRNRQRWRQRRNEWDAAHPICADCSNTTNLKVVWRGEGPKPFRSMLEAFRCNQEYRDRILAQCVNLCYTCWLATRTRNPHGGGAAGIAHCKCAPCVDKRREYNRISGRARHKRLQERRERLIEKGVEPGPYRKAKKDRNSNAWSKTEPGREWRHSRRHDAKQAWLAGRTCVECGTADKIRCTWIDPPGPLPSTARIWACGKKMQAKYLEKCHTLCVCCLRTRSWTTRREGQ